MVGHSVANNFLIAYLLHLILSENLFGTPLLLDLIEYLIKCMIVITLYRYTRIWLWHLLHHYWRYARHGETWNIIGENIWDFYWFCSKCELQYSSFRFGYLNVYHKHILIPWLRKTFNGEISDVPLSYCRNTYCIIVRQHGTVSEMTLAVILLLCRWNSKHIFQIIFISVVVVIIIFYHFIRLSMHFRGNERAGNSTKERSERKKKPKRF